MDIKMAFVDSARNRQPRAFFESNNVTRNTRGGGHPRATTDHLEEKDANVSKMWLWKDHLFWVDTGE